MRGSNLDLLLLLLAAVARTTSSIVYVTDLPSYSALAPCTGEAAVELEPDLALAPPRIHQMARHRVEAMFQLEP